MVSAFPPTPKPTPETEPASAEELAMLAAEQARRNAELAELYARLAQGASPKIGATALQTEVVEPLEAVEQPEKEPFDVEAWAEAQHKNLSTVWSERYGLEIPPIEELKDKFTKAHGLINDLVGSLVDQSLPAKIREAKEKEIRKSFGILLVPPTDAVGWPIKEDMRKKQGLKGTHGWKNHDFHFRKNKITDSINPKLPKPQPNEGWRVFAADINPKGGLHIDSPKYILESGNYMLGEHDTRALGPAEYAALTLQLVTPIDKGTRTWLLHGIEDDAPLAPTAGFDAGVETGHFTFDLMNSTYNRGSIRFRPAVEIE